MIWKKLFILVIILTSGCITTGNQYGCSNDGQLIVTEVDTLPDNATVHAAGDLTDNELIAEAVRASSETGYNATRLSPQETVGVERTLQSLSSSNPGLWYVDYRGQTMKISFSCYG